MLAGEDDRRPLSRSATEQVFARSIDEVARQVGVEIERGLAGRDVAERQRLFGKNRLRRHRTRSAIGILAGQLRSLIVWLLAAAAMLSFYVGDRPKVSFRETARPQA